MAEGALAHVPVLFPVKRCVKPVKFFVKFSSSKGLTLSSYSKFFFGGFVCYQGVASCKFDFFEETGVCQVFAVADIRRGGGLRFDGPVKTERLTMERATNHLSTF
jgi:hypothetical protein